jgi:regulator of sigma E protease
MEIVIKLSQFLLSLSLLIVLHELGHFIPAKVFKTRVEKFYLFFDVKFSLFKKKIGETVYGIGWLPLGGYVKIAGMIDESMDKEQMALPPQPWEFRSKPAWQRLVIMLGGVTVNFILAFLIYIGLAWAYGTTYLKNTELKDGVAVGKTAETLGFRTGDKIVGIDGAPIENFNNVNALMLYARTVTVERGGKQQTIAIPEDIFDKVVTGGSNLLVAVRQPFVIGEVPDSSANKNILMPKDIVKSFNGVGTKYEDQVRAQLAGIRNRNVSAVVLRDGKDVPVTVSVSAKGKLGVVIAGLESDELEKLGYYHFSEQHYSFGESIPQGITMGWDQMKNYGQQLKAIFTPSTGAYKGVGGFAAIYKIFPEEWSWLDFWERTAFLSIMLGVLNLLPIPALDGGHVMFLLYEMVTRRKPSDKFMEYAQLTGFVILLGLILFANGNDIYKAIVGK